MENQKQTCLRILKEFIYKEIGKEKIKQNEYVMLYEGTTYTINDLASKDFATYKKTLCVMEWDGEVDWNKEWDGKVDWNKNLPLFTWFKIIKGKELNGW